MTTKHFNAILAKNNIITEIMQADKNNDIDIPYIIHELKDIEKYIGEANQPSVDEIIKEYTHE